MVTAVGVEDKRKEMRIQRYIAKDMRSALGQVR
jgi:hypothetical protein